MRTVVTVSHVLHMDKVSYINFLSHKTDDVFYETAIAFPTFFGDGNVRESIDPERMRTLLGVGKQVIIYWSKKLQSYVVSWR